jgi:hypothetical protein
LSIYNPSLFPILGNLGILYLDSHDLKNAI